MKKPLKFGAIGRSEWLYDTIVALMNEGHELTFIISAPEAPEYKRTSADFRKLAEDSQVAFLETPNLRSSEAREFLDNAPETNVVASINYSSIISDEVMQKYPLGILNAHGGDLPRYRGNACQAWAIINGEKHIAMCIHRMIGGEVDSGDILAREYLYLTLETKIRDVFDWFDEIIPALYALSFRELSENPDFYLEQQSKDPAKALRCYPRRPEDGRIDWSNSPCTIVRLVNASGDPYAGAFTYLDGRRIYVHDAGIHEDGENYCSIPGQIVEFDKSNKKVVVATPQGKVWLRSLAFENKEDVWSSIRSTRQRFSTSKSHEET